MKYDLGDVYTMTPQEVAEQLVNGTLADDERIKDVCFKDGELNMVLKKLKIKTKKKAR